MAAEVVQAPNDKQQLVAMVEQVERNTGALPQVASADAGYFSEQAIEKLEAMGSARSRMRAVFGDSCSAAWRTCAQSSTSSR